MKRRVVVTGLGVVTSLGNHVGDLWRRLLAGESGIHSLKLLDTAGHKVTFGGEISDWDPERVHLAQGHPADRPLRPVRARGRHRGRPRLRHRLRAAKTPSAAA